MRYRFQNRKTVYEVTLDRNGNDYQANVDGQVYHFEVLDAEPGQLTVRFSGSNDSDALGQAITLYYASEGGEKWISLNGCTYRLEKPVSRSQRLNPESAGGEAIRAPMPAQVRAVESAEGDQVEKGQTLLLLEAMKMEIRIKAPSSGKVKRMLVKAGQTVDRNEILAEIGEV